MTATDATPQQPRHETSLAVWDIPAAIAAGEPFAVKVGAKSSAGGGRIEVLDGSAVVASGQLGDMPWPGTGALFWTEVEIRAPEAPGTVTLTVRFDAAELDQPHLGASAPFNVSVVAKPEHTLTVTVASGGVPIEEAYIRFGPYRAATDAAGRAEIKIAKGRYELHVWKAGYDAPATPLAIEADTFVQIDARALPQQDADAVWTA